MLFRPQADAIGYPEWIKDDTALNAEYAGVSLYIGSKYRFIRVVVGIYVIVKRGKN